jgi:hypothetical protein
MDFAHHPEFYITIKHNSETGSVSILKCILLSPDNDPVGETVL